jgi:hypothetical protein
MMFLCFRCEIILVACMFPADVRHKSASRVPARPACVPLRKPGASSLFPMPAGDATHAQAKAVPRAAENTPPAKTNFVDHHGTCIRDEHLYFPTASLAAVSCATRIAPDPETA